MFKIGELSKLCCIPVKTLRYYDAEGLLIPDEIDRFTGYRYYSASKLADCNVIIALKELGFSLDEIKRHMRADSREDVLRLLDSKQGELRASAELLASRLKRLESITKIITEGESLMLKTVIKSGETIRALCRRGIFGDKAKALSELESLRSSLPRGVRGSRSAIINYETEFKESDFDLAICAEIVGKPPEILGCAEKILEFPGETASIVCSEAELDQAYRSMTRQLDESGLHIDGPFCEIRYDDGTVELKTPVRRSREADRGRIKESGFIDDPTAVGLWRTVDILPSVEQFLPDRPKYNGQICFPEICFLPGGAKYWVFSWTAGYLFIKDEACRYEYFERDGKTYMAVRDAAEFGVHILKRIDSASHTPEDLAQTDAVDLPFIPDDRALGRWKAVAFSETPDSFDPGAEYQGGLFVTGREFLAAGEVISETQNGNIRQNWTKGGILSKFRYPTNEKYLIKTLGGREYLFCEWKSGDYVWGRRTPMWYVFIKE